MKFFLCVIQMGIFLACMYSNPLSAQSPTSGRSFKPVDVTEPFDSASFFKQFKSGYAMTNGIRMHYVIGGTGKQVVVLLHGFPSDWYSWRRIMPVLALDYTIIAPDLRGLGLSDKPQSGYSKKNLAKDVYELVHQLGYKYIYIAGYDFGAPVSFAYTCEYPQDVRKLVMIESGGVAGYGLERLMDITHGGFWHFGFFMQPEYPEMLIKGREKEFFTAFSYGNIVREKAAFSQMDIDHYISNLSTPDGLDGALGYYRTYPQDVLDNRAFAKRKITIPILAIDGLLKGRTKKSLEKLATNVEGNVIPDGGHWLAEERPNDILKQLIPFFHK